MTLGAGTEASGFYNQELYVFEVDGGAFKQLTSKKWRSVNRACWLEDGSGLVFLAAAENQDDDRTQLWHVSYPSGAVNRITNDTHAHGINGLGLTADARTIVTIEADSEVNIWTLPSNGDAGKAKQVLSRAGNRGIEWTPDGKIIFASRASGTQDIWLANADGSNQKQLTSDAARDYTPVVSHDGRYVVFQSVRSDSMPHLWRMDIDGGNLKQLTNAPGYDAETTISRSTTAPPSSGIGATAMCPSHRTTANRTNRGRARSAADTALRICIVRATTTGYRFGLNRKTRSSGRRPPLCSCWAADPTSVSMSRSRLPRST